MGLKGTCVCVYRVCLMLCFSDGSLAVNSLLQFGVVLLMTAMVKAEADHSPDTLQFNTNDGVVAVCVHVYLSPNK